MIYTLIVVKVMRGIYICKKKKSPNHTSKMGAFYVNYNLLTVHLKNEMVKKKMQFSWIPSRLSESES